MRVEKQQELKREVKRSCRRDKGVYVESMAERAEEAGGRDDVRDVVRDYQEAEWEIPEYV